MNLTKSSSKSLDFDGVAFDSFSACCLNLFRIFLPPSSTFCDVFLYHLEWVVVVLVTQSFLTLCNPMDCSPPSSSIHGIFLARILEWVAISSSRGSSRLWDRTRVSGASCIAGRFSTSESPRKPRKVPENLPFYPYIYFMEDNSEGQRMWIPRMELPIRI